MQKLARKIVGREVEIFLGKKKSATDGEKILVFEPSLRWPKLAPNAHDDMRRKSTAHEASHIKRFKGVSADEFYKIYADPLSPGTSSIPYVRKIMNIVEDALVDQDAGKEIGQEVVDRVNRFYVWNRQGGTRLSLAELETMGSQGMCAAFIEAVYQYALYGKIIETYQSKGLDTAAEKACKARTAFGAGSISREQAMRQVLDVLRQYCPPPWELPPEYQPPQGNSGGSGSGSGNGEGSGEGDGDGDGEGDGEGDGSGNGSGKGKGKGKGKGEGNGEGEGDGEGEGEGDGKPGEEGKGKKGKPGEGDGKEGEKDGEGSESQGGGDGSPSDSDSRGAEIGAGAGDPRAIESAPEKRFEDNNLEALLKMLERVIAERSDKTGRGIPRWKVWSPGRQISSPDEIQRYQEDEYFGIDPLQRRCIRRRDMPRHLLAIFLDSSGSVGDKLFSMLYRVCGEMAQKVADLEGCYLGVGQFSGGASWVLEPTRDVAVIREFADTTPKRLYSGGTTVGEIYGLLPNWFSGYKTADLVVLTDGFVEDGKQLAGSLEASHTETACEIKLHGVVIRQKRDTTVKQFEKAKDQLPEFVRVWHLGEHE
ncbi:MAG TPA: hypothetical protein PLR18_01415 [bacterium]|nr:hypothetical protein [bacterium]